MGYRNSDCMGEGKMSNPKERNEVGKERRAPAAQVKKGERKARRLATREHQA